MGWYNTLWKYRKKITIDHTKVLVSRNNYPLYIDLADFDTDFFNRVMSTGADIVLTSNDGTTKLKRQLVSISTTDLTGELFVSVPSVLSTVDTDIYIYFGNSAGAETNDTDTWSSAYKTVYHLLDNTTSSVTDSTVNANNGTKKGSNQPLEVTGDIGKAQDFNGVDEYISATAITGMLDSFSISFLFNPDYINSGDSTHRVLFSQTDASDNRIAIGLLYGSLRCSLKDNRAGTTYPKRASELLTQSVWQHAMITYDGTGTNGVKLYINGVSSATQADTTGLSNTGFKLGCSTSIANFYNGLIDEFRVYAGVLTENDTKTEYNNLTTSTFYEVDVLEQDPTVDPQVNGTVIARPAINEVSLPFPDSALITPVWIFTEHTTLDGTTRREIMGRKYKYTLSWDFISVNDYNELELEVNGLNALTLTYAKWPQSESGVLVLAQLSERELKAGTGSVAYLSAVTLTLTEIYSRI